jgi:hypothetical protein
MGRGRATAFAHRPRLATGAWNGARGAPAHLRFRRRRPVGAEGDRERLRERRIVYAADSAGYPYGTKSAAEIEARVPALLGRLVERYDPRLIVIACNTASTIALDAVRAALDLPIVGTVPAIKPAAALSRTRFDRRARHRGTVVQPYVDRLPPISPRTAR